MHVICIIHLQLNTITTLFTNYRKVTNLGNLTQRLNLFLTRQVRPRKVTKLRVSESFSDSSNICTKVWTYFSQLNKLYKLFFINLLK